MLRGFIEADPLVAGVLVGAVAVLSVAFVVQRIRQRGKGGT